MPNWTFGFLSNLLRRALSSRASSLSVSSFSSSWLREDSVRLVSKLSTLAIEFLTCTKTQRKVFSKTKKQAQRKKGTNYLGQRPLKCTHIFRRTIRRLLHCFDYLMNALFIVEQDFRDRFMMITALNSQQVRQKHQTEYARVKQPAQSLIKK